MAIPPFDPIQTMNPSPKQPVRIALIGAGGIAQAHSRAILNHPNRVKCVALCDVSEANLESLGKLYADKPAAFSDWKEMLRDSSLGIEAVVICLPHHLHAPAILDALAAGKHVLCEKPLCTDLDEADRLVEAVNASGLVFMPGHNQLCSPFVRRAKEMIEQGVIGNVRWLRATECFHNPGVGHGGHWRTNAKLQGGGELIDTGYHPTYSLLYLAGAPVTAIRSVMSRFEVTLEGEDSASMLLQFANGAIGEVTTSWAYARPHGAYPLHMIGDNGQIFGNRGTLFHLPKGYQEPARIELTRHADAVEMFIEQMACFADCVRGLARPLHSVEESREVLRIILKATENAAGWENVAPLKQPVSAATH